MRSSGCVAGRNALERVGDEIPRLPLRVDLRLFLELAEFGRVRGGLVARSAAEARPRFVDGQAGDLLELMQLSLASLSCCWRFLDVDLAVGQALLAAEELGQLALEASPGVRARVPRNFAICPRRSSSACSASALKRIACSRASISASRRRLSASRFASATSSSRRRAASPRPERCWSLRTRASSAAPEEETDDDLQRRRACGAPWGFTCHPPSRPSSAL